MSLACAALISTGAVAQSTGANQVSSLETEIAYDNQTLQSFAAAAAGVLTLRRQYYPRIRAAEIGGSKDKADLLFKEMRERMHAAIRNSGFSADQYRAISRAAKTDENLRGRINAILQGKPPALQGRPNVARVAPQAPKSASAKAVSAETRTTNPPAAEPPDNSARQRLKAELNKAHAERDRFQAEQIALRKKTEELERQLAAEKAQAQALQKKNKTQLDALAGEVTSLKDELSTVQSRDSSLRDELAAERARADAEQSSKEAKLAAFRQEISGFIGRLATARQELDSLAVDLNPIPYSQGGRSYSPFEAIQPLRKEPNSIERLLKKAGPQNLTRLELEKEIAAFKKERLEQKLERAVIQKEIAELSRVLAATYQAMAALIGEPVNFTVAAAELDVENETYTLDVSQETAQLFENAPEQFAPAHADPPAGFLIDEGGPLDGGDPVNEPGAREPAPSAALEPGLTAFLRINAAPQIQSATVSGPATPADPAAEEFAGLPIIATGIAFDGDAMTQTPSYTNNVLGGAMAYEAADFRRAYEIWAELAQSGDSGAQFHLGALYFEGRGTGKDFPQSYFWLRIAAYQGNLRATRLLATVAGELTSDQISTSDGQAREWLEQRSIEVTQFQPGSNNRL